MAVDLSKEIRDLTKIELSSSDMAFISNSRKSLRLIDQKLQIIRKKSMLSLLEDSTQSRKIILDKIMKWIELIEARLMNPETLNEIEINKVISIFKSIMAFTTKITGQFNDLEGIFADYTKLDNKEHALVSKFETKMQAPTENQQQTQTKEAKEMLMKVLLDGLTKNTEEAKIITVENEKKEKKTEEQIKLDEEDIEDQLKDI